MLLLSRIKVYSLLVQRHQLVRGVSNRWNGIWNGMVEWNGGWTMEWNGELMYIVAANSCTWRCSSKLTMCLGVLSHHRGCMSKSSVCWQHSSLSGIMMSHAELRVLGDQLQYHA